MLQGDIGILRRQRSLGIRGACDEPRLLCRGQDPDGLRHPERTGLEEDAPARLRAGGDDDYLEEDAPSSLSARW